MRKILLFSLLLPAIFASAQEDTAEVRTGTIYVKKPKSDVYIRTKIEFSFVDNEPAYRDKGGLRTGINKKKKKIIQNSEYVVVDPVPEIEGAPQAAFDYTDFFSHYLDYRCPNTDSSHVDSVTLSIFLTSFGKHEYGIVEQSYEGMRDTCLQKLKTSSIHVLQRITQWRTGGMAFSNESFMERSSYGRLKIFVSGKPFPDETSIPVKNVETIKN